MREDYLATFDPLLLLPSGLLIGSELIPEAFKACFPGFAQAETIEGGPYEAIALFHPTALLLRQAYDHLVPGGRLLVKWPRTRSLRSCTRTLEAEGFAVREGFGRLELPGYAYALCPLQDRRMLRFLWSRHRLKRWLSRWIPPERFATAMFILAEKP